LYGNPCYYIRVDPSGAVFDSANNIEHITDAKITDIHDELKTVVVCPINLFFMALIIVFIVK